MPREINNSDLGGSSAVLLNGSNGTSDVLARVANVLDFLGVPSRTLNAATVNEGILRGINGRAIICAASAFLETPALQDADATFGGALVSAFVFADDPEAFTAVARLAIGDPNARVDLPQPGAGITVSSNNPKFCRELSGLTIQQRSCHPRYPVLRTGAVDCCDLLTCDDGLYLGRTEFRGLQVYLCTASNVIDLNSPAPILGFDVRDHCLDSVPLLLFARAMFSSACWNGLTRAANLVIDDPLLKPRYGCIDFRTLLEAMEAHDFSTTVAFIPWNWRRSDRRIVQMFLERPRQLSLVVHGCDHTGGEFGSRSEAELAARAELALERMARHHDRTAVPHGEVMVFPQGVFSDGAPGVLKQKGYIAAVNSDVWCTGDEPGRVSLRDCWDVAVMDYGAFPIFTRRYPDDGVENFAFDLLLGKPAICVIHHDYCLGGYENLIRFVKAINSLPSPPAWLPLDEVVRRSGRVRQRDDGTLLIEMYGTELWFHNETDRELCAVVRRRESDLGQVRDVWSNAPQIRRLSSDDDWLQLGVTVPAGCELRLKVSYEDKTVGASKAFSSNQFSVMARRYLSELRDGISRYPKAGRIMAALRGQ